jgi:hypothetical protein
MEKQIDANKGKTKNESPYVMYMHSKPGTQKRATLCAVFIDSWNRLVISGHCCDSKNFIKRDTRGIAAARTSKRPFLNLPCYSVKEAAHMLKQIAPSMFISMMCMENVHLMYNRVPKEELFHQEALEEAVVASIETEAVVAS